MLGVVAASWLVASGASAQITPSLQTNRTSGVAPLAVFFDATDTTHTDKTLLPFNDLTFTWDFGDSSSGTWSTDGRPKNTARGPLAAHVYDSPGSYTARLTVKDANGVTVSSATTITVQDPDAIYSGAQTICVSATSVFTGCPTGAQQVKQADFDTALRSYVATNRRVLFRRGDTFQSNQGNPFNLAGPVTIGAYGTGAKPVVQVVSNIGGSGTIELSGQTPNVRDWRIMDLSIRSAMYGDERGVSAVGRVEDLLVYRLDITDYANGLFFYGSVPAFYGQGLHRSVFAVDVNIHRSRTSPVAGSYPITLAAYRSALLGTTSTNVGSTTHVMRCDRMVRSLIAHNNLRDPDPARHVLKLHNEWGTSTWTENVLISENQFHGGDDNWSVVIAPQDTSSDERLRRILIEGNYFTVSNTGGGRVALLVAADESVARNNVMNYAGDNVESVCVQFERHGVEPAHFGNRAENNTCYDPDAVTTPVIAVNVSSASSTVRGNLLVAQRPGAFVGRGPAGTVIEDNVTLGSSPFVVATPTQVNDFALRAGTPAIDAVPSQVRLGYDLNGNPRRLDGDGNGSAISDAGAFELGGGAPPPPPPPPTTPPAAPVLLP
jgi:PKD repeat protein